MSFHLHEHQVNAIFKLSTGKILVGDVGSGKSITALAYFTRLDEHKKILVLTTAKKRDSGEWFGDAMKMSLRNEMIVDSWNNIKKYEDLRDVFIIFDEQRVVGSGAWVKTFISMAKKNDWILLSATPADTWMDLVPVFIANGFFRNKTEFGNAHVRYSRYTKYPKVDGYYDTPYLEELRRRIYVEMPLAKRAKREEHTVHVDHNREEELKLHRDRWNIYEGQPLKDVGEMMRYLRKSANSHWSRYSALKSICKDNPRVIVFYNMNYELDILRNLASDLGVPVAEWNGHKHEPVPEGNEWIYLVQYQAGSEGWNCVATDTMVFYSLPYSYRNYEQAKGRIDRLNTEYDTLHYYIFRSRAIIDQAIWRALTRKKNFQASAFAKKTWPKMTPIN